MRIGTGSKIIALVVMDPESRMPLLAQMESFVPEIHLAADCKQAGEMLSRGLSIQVVLTADTLPDGTWLSVLNSIKQTGTATQLVVCSRLGDTRLWCEVLQCGAYDLLAEPYEEAEVRRIVESAALHSQPRRPAQSVPRQAQSHTA